MSPCRFSFAVLVLSLCGLAVSQSPAGGFRLFGDLQGTDTWLVDAAGSVVHTWPSSLVAGVSIRMLDDGTLLRAIKAPNSINFPGGGGGVQRVALDGTVLWDYRYNGPGVLSHHDIEALPNGNVLMIAWEELTAMQAVAEGRDPALVTNAMYPDHVIEVQPTGPTSGTIVWEWHVTDHLIQDFDPTKNNFGVVANHPELVDINYPPNADGDWNHVNGIDYDPVNDWIILSAHRQNEVWIIDHSTTTAEAAGHTGGARGRGGDLLFRWGNPEAYRRGLATQRILGGQHAPRFLPPSGGGNPRVLLFNNNPGDGGTSEALEFELPLDATGNFVVPVSGPWGPSEAAWTYDGNFHSNIVSSAERLPNGHTLICSGAEGRVFEIDGAGQEVWTYSAPGLVFHAHHVERRAWIGNRDLSVSGGGTTDLDVIVGSELAGEPYLMVGSITGTSPSTVIGGLELPLVVDDYTTYTLQFYNTSILTDSFAFLDADGRGHASFNLPAGLLSMSDVGIEVHHAFIVASNSSTILEISDPVTFKLVP